VPADSPGAIRTADLCDEFGSVVQVVTPELRDFGGVRAFHGAVATVRVLEDNGLVRSAFEEGGAGRVLVVDGQGSLRCALVGDVMAQLAADHGWSGVVVNGCVRDSQALAVVPVGIKALATSPRRPAKTGAGTRDVAVEFAGVIFHPGAYLYADVDGVVVAESRLV
jgi:regulator of ribonuclease activity A